MRTIIKRIIAIIIPLIIIPFILIVGFFFFGTIALIVLAIIGLFLLLSILFYLNKKFKYFLMHIRTSGKAYSEEKTEQKFHKKTKKGEEIVIEQIEEHIEEKK